MPSLKEYLPGIPVAYWGLVEQARTNISVPANASDYGILPNSITGQEGIFTTVTIQSDSSSLTFNVIIDDIQKSGNIDLLYLAGYVGYPVPGLPWLSKYETGNYVVNLITEVPFTNTLNVTVSNTTDLPIKISAMVFSAIILKPGFYRELAKIRNQQS